jgi:hypothetical protein
MNGQRGWSDADKFRMVSEPVVEPNPSHADAPGGATFSSGSSGEGSPRERLVRTTRLGRCIRDVPRGRHGRGRARVQRCGPRVRYRARDAKNLRTGIGSNAATSGSSSQPEAPDASTFSSCIASRFRFRAKAGSPRIFNYGADGVPRNAYDPPERVERRPFRNGRDGREPSRSVATRHDDALPGFRIRCPANAKARGEVDLAPSTPRAPPLTVRAALPRAEPGTRGQRRERYAHHSLKCDLPRQTSLLVAMLGACRGRFRASQRLPRLRGSGSSTTRTSCSHDEASAPSGSRK